VTELLDGDLRSSSSTPLRDSLMVFTSHRSEPKIQREGEEKKTSEGKERKRGRLLSCAKSISLRTFFIGCFGAPRRAGIAWEEREERTTSRSKRESYGISFPPQPLPCRPLFSIALQSPSHHRCTRGPPYVASSRRERRKREESVISLTKKKRKNGRKTFRSGPGEQLYLSYHLVASPYAEYLHYETRRKKNSERGEKKGRRCKV